MTSGELTDLAAVQAEALRLAEQVQEIYGRVAALAENIRRMHEGPAWEAFLDLPVSQAGAAPFEFFLEAWLRLIADEDLDSVACELRRAGTATPSILRPE